jgi:hypothetical protein
LLKKKESLADSLVYRQVPFLLSCFATNRGVPLTGSPFDHLPRSNVNAASTCCFDVRSNVEGIGLVLVPLDPVL